ncbi:F-box/FBD/LRR-repeat protein At1g16930-like, partial [Rutidosis leptorrhynchoides]|uniref:F-box/FBD/LRR-repeat protein At1g16930-like n=1 Tax=Rutidosis leptorrhynchoides TaxID=125765 RepID=UPI003A997C91
MDSRWGHGEVFMHVEEDDRISSLPDDLIHKILSFISLKRAVQTSVLSSRWKYIWTSLPYLNFSSEDFSTLPKFSKFVEHFISGRNNLLQVSSVQLNYCGLFTNEVVRTIMNYTFTHNAQQLSIDCHDNDLPVSLFSSQSLKSLTLYQLEPSPTWDLPCLTTLYLDYVDFDVDKGIGHISKCANLKNLTLSCCSVQSDDDDVTVGCFDIHLPKLCNLTLEDGRSFEMRLNVFASQLENLTVIKWDYEALHLQSIPKLVSLVFQGRYSGLLQISSSFDLCFLERVDLSIYVPFYEEIKDLKDDHNLVALLRQIHNATYITLDLDTVQLISFFGELMLHQPSPFANLKHLKVYPFDPYSAVQQTMPTEVKNYFLDASPGATFTMVSS